MATTTPATAENTELFIESKHSKVRKYSIRYFEGERSAFTLGFIHPIIFIPESVSEDDKRWIVRHEVQHVHHFDTIIKFAGLLVILVHWYCPISWFCFKSLELTLELICDEKTLRGSSDEEKREYINLILNHSKNTQNPNILCQSFQGNYYKMTKERVLMIKNNNKKHFLFALLSTVVSIFIGFTPVLAYQRPELKNLESNYLLDFPDDSVESLLFTDGFDATSQHATNFGMESDWAFKEHNSYILFEDGHIMIISTENTRASIFCPHTDLRKATKRLHARYKDGSCQVHIFDAIACYECGYIASQTLVETHTYVKCPHQ